ncbi:hypothetical protein Glove_321g27 [Diversispora epigaea]|uniref:Uncharacterized protein n=1 Tax=Diversispora epigaea TaxID=1348612 RepID=A0A397HN98_9GLOM|nr:hypothetical protein Glove_321g27 [Diversispora epigaea]
MLIIYKVNPSYISLVWNTIFDIMLAYFALSIIETLAISHLKRVHDQEIEALEKKVKDNEFEIIKDTSPMSRSAISAIGRGYLSD